MLRKTLLLGRNTLRLSENERSILNNDSNRVFLRGNFVFDVLHNQPLKLGNNWVLLHQSSLTREIPLISAVNKNGEITWQMETKQVLDREKETGKMVWATQEGQKLHWLLESNKGLIWLSLDAQSGKIIRNIRL